VLMLAESGGARLLADEPSWLTLAAEMRLQALGARSASLQLSSLLRMPPSSAQASAETSDAATPVAAPSGATGEPGISAMFPVRWLLHFAVLRSDTAWNVLLLLSIATIGLRKHPAVLVQGGGSSGSCVGAAEAAALSQCRCGTSACGGSGCKSH
jgi:hypothetical protein